MTTAFCAITPTCAALAAGLAPAGIVVAEPGWLETTGMTVSSNINNQNAGLLIDGKVSVDSVDAWDSGWFADSAYPLIATIDMKRSYALSGIRVWHGIGAPTGTPIVKLSQDGKTFTAAASQVITRGGWGNWDVINFATTGARYVSLVIPDAADRFDIQEIGFYSAPKVVSLFTKTANDGVPAYRGYFAYGSNMGYYGWQDNDAQVADLLVGGTDGMTGVGVRSLRPGLYDDFIQTYGLNVRVSDFAHYQSLGARDLTLFLNASGHVGPGRRDPNSYGGCSQQSWLQANLYKPIWAIDAQGHRTVNPDNYLATYVAGVVATYKPFGVKFYEVWNEPDFTPNYQAAYDPGDPQYWGRVNPQPCDLINTYAPISHHVRLHRIVYEVVKGIDPTAYVATGGIGYPNYLAALLRNTDNPGGYPQNPGEGDGTTEGAPSARYPLTGGAYFDVLSFHSYPQYGLNYWVGSGKCQPGEGEHGPSGNQRCYSEHSDAAVAQFLGLESNFAALLTGAGYDGTRYPGKYFIATETNVPRVPARYAESPTQLSPDIQNWGSDAYAVNYILKALVLGQKHAVRQIYIYGASDEVQANGTDCSGNVVGTDNTKVQGLYLDLGCGLPAAATHTVQGTAYRTISKLLFGYAYDSARTQLLALPAGTDGAAFRNLAGHERYVLWAKTTTDRLETATATYSFPSSLGLASLRRYEWDFAVTGKRAVIHPAVVSLGASPSFFE